MNLALWMNQTEIKGQKMTLSRVRHQTEIASETATYIWHLRATGLSAEGLKRKS
jgi:hypothetical protein